MIKTFSKRQLDSNRINHKTGKYVKKFSFKRIFAVLVKEFTQLKRDRITYGMILGIPVMQLLIFGYAINMDPRHLPAAVYSNDNNAFAQSVVQSIEHTTYVDVKYRPNSESEMDDLMHKGKIMLAVTIPNNFTRNVLKGERAQILAEVDASDPTTAAGAVAAVSALPKTALEHESFIKQRAMKNISSVNPDLTPVKTPFEVVVHRKYNPENITAYNIVPGLLGVVLTMTLVMMTGVAVTREFEHGTMENLLSTPATSLEIMLGKLIPYILIGLTQTIVILTLAKFLFNVPMAQNPAGWAALAAGIALFVLGNLCLGYLISTFAKTQMQAMQMSTFIFLPSMFLSGFAFPFYGLPDWGQAIGNVIPLTYFIRIVRGVLLKGLSIADLIGNIQALMIFVTVIITIALIRARKTLD